MFYVVSELFYDFIEVDDVFQVVVVVIDMLWEVEVFVVEYGFVLVSFVVIFVGDEFDGEFFFGVIGVVG